MPLTGKATGSVLKGQAPSTGYSASLQGESPVSNFTLQTDFVVALCRNMINYNEKIYRLPELHCIRNMPDAVVTVTDDCDCGVKVHGEPDGFGACEALLITRLRSLPHTEDMPRHTVCRGRTRWYPSGKPD